MTTMGLDAIFTGTAFRAGDVVILKSRKHLGADARKVINQQMRGVTERTGVHFVVIGDDLDVVHREPNKEEA